MYTYDPKLVTVVFAQHIFTDFSSDGPSASYNSERTTLAMGLAGKGQRAMSNDYSGRVILPLMAFGADNDKLSELFATQRLTGLDVSAFLLSDEQGTTVLKARSMWIVGVPEVQFGAEGGTREWVLETDDLKMFIGGNFDI